METLSLVSATVTLVLVMDPIGNIPFFLSALRAVPPNRRQVVILRELIIAYAALLVFLFGGQTFLRFLQLRGESISIAGGIILFLIALRMVFPGMKQEAEIEGEPLVVPLAIPGVAGPSALATVLLLVNSQPQRLLDWLLALTVAWVVCAIVLVASPVFYRALGERGVTAMERLMGMILVTVAVQMFLDGVRHYLRT